MKQLLCSVAFLVLSQITWAQNIKAIDSDGYLKLSTSTDTLYIINHWATWCLPCVKELPYFEQINEMYKDQPVKVALVSFDFKKQFPDQLTAWVNKKGLKSDVYWFSEQKPNEYIPKIAPEWEGNLPATYLINGKTNEAVFFSEEISLDTMKEWIERELKTLN